MGRQLGTSRSIRTISSASCLTSSPVRIPQATESRPQALGAVTAANMALAGLTSVIPCDEVIDAMGRVGSLLSPDLRETGQGGLAVTPTSIRIAEQLAEET